MPDKAYTVPGTGETRYRHITSSQQRLMSKQNWERTVQRARLRKEKEAEPWFFCPADDCLVRTGDNFTGCREHKDAR